MINYFLSGKYIYIEASSSSKYRRRKGDIARLISTKVKVPRICLSFYYHMFGKDMGELRIKILLQNGSSEVVWKKTGDKGFYWHKADVSFESVNSYQVCLMFLILDWQGIN